MLRRAPNHPCSADPSHYSHRGQCGSYLAEEVAHFAKMDGVSAMPGTKVRWPKPYRERIAARLGVTPSTLERALLRHAPTGGT